MTLDPSILEAVADQLADAARDRLDDTGRRTLAATMDAALAGTDGQTQRQLARVLTLVDALHPGHGTPGLLPALAANPDGWTSLRRDALAADEAERLRIRNRARELVAAETAEALDLPARSTLCDFIDDHADTETEWLIGGLWPRGGRVLLAAEAKAGKTTMVGNLVRTLADGLPFLGAYAPVGLDDHPERPRVVLLDTEMTEPQLARWLRQTGIHNAEAVDVVSLRGRAGTFNPADPANRALWVPILRDAQTVILDPVGPIISAHGVDENSNTDVGDFLAGWDALMLAAGVESSLLVHHTGHEKERSRGASKWKDSADALWTLVRDGDTADAARFFRAMGRDVDVPEQRLDYAPDTRTLTTGGGSRRDAAGSALVPELMALLERAGEPLSRNQVEIALMNDGHSRADIRAAVRIVTVPGGLCLEVPGRHGAKRLAPRHQTSPESGGEVLESGPANRSTSPLEPGEDGSA